MRLTFKRMFLLVYFLVVVLLPLRLFTLKRSNVPEMKPVDKVTRPNLAGELARMLVKPKVKNELKFGKVWPDENQFSDRIIEQLEYEPEISANKTILIYLPHNLGGWDIGWNEDVFENCKVNNCKLTERRLDGMNADAIVFKDSIMKQPHNRPKDQIWIMYMLENPYNTLTFQNFNFQINYSATYRYDSDIVTPYEKFHYINENKKSNNVSTNFALGKTKKVAWFVSNCIVNNKRLSYAEELGKHISVDIYGSCGPLKCNRLDSACFQMLNKDYKFYLSFENANCQDYITEKFFVNGLQNLVIPIVMGASKYEYERVAPDHSFIHVDDFDSAKSLANYLNYLDNNDTAYNEYFFWKEKGKYEFMNTKFWCRLCAMLNKPKFKVYENFEEWWRGPGVCRENSKIFSK